MPKFIPLTPWRNERFFTAHAHMSNRALSAEFGGGESAWRDWRGRHGLPPYTEIDEPLAVWDDEAELKAYEQEILATKESSEPEVVELTEVEDIIERDRRVITLRKQLSETRNLYHAALRSSTLSDTLVEQAKELLPRLKPVHVPAVLKTTNKRSVESAVLAWADWHGDEVVSIEIMQGMNAYDPHRMCRRVESMIDSTLNIMLHHHSGTLFDEIVVFDVGDGITGPLHEENKFTNAMPPFEALTMVADVKSRALMDLAEHIPQVKFVGIPGNHWRYIKNVPWKLPTETSDWLIYKFMQLRLADQPNIEVVVPKAWGATVNVKGWDFALNHGYTDAKGGYGGISYYSFNRSDGKRTAIDARNGRYTPYRVYGHVHTPAELAKQGGGGRTIICPSLKGGDEYAFEGLGAYSDPQQKLWGVHPEHGKTWTYDLNVANYDNKDKCRYDEAIPAR